jgi:transcriptional regulator
VAHVYGNVRLIHEREALERIVTALAGIYEGDTPGAWRLADSEPANRASLRGIVGFELFAAEVQVKFKLNQNHPRGNVEGAIRGLRAQGSADAEATAALMASVLAAGNAGKKGPERDA